MSNQARDVDWQKTLQRAVNLAAEDPDEFAEEAKQIAKRFGKTIEQVYQQVQDDSNHNMRRSVFNSVIRGCAKKLKRDLGI